MTKIYFLSLTAILTPFFSSNVVHVPKKILNSSENLRKSVNKNLQYEAFFLQF